MFRLLFNCQFCCGGFVLRSEGDIVDTSRQTLSVEEYLARRTFGVPYLFAQGIEYRHAIGLDGRDWGRARMRSSWWMRVQFLDSGNARRMCRCSRSR